MQVADWRTPIVAADRALYGSARSHAQHVTLELGFDTALDIDRLRTALGRVLAHAPILASAGDPTCDSHWRALPDDLALQRAWQLTSSLAHESERTHWHNRALRPAEGPLVRLVVQHDGRRVLLTLHHAVGDGRSMLTVLRCLHAAYTGQPLPALAAPRDAWSVLHGATARPIGFLQALLRMLARMLRYPPRRSGAWCAAAQTGPQRTFIRVPLPGMLARIQQVARPKGYTVNDVLVATLALAWRTQRRALALPDAPFTTGILVDCRRYQTEAQASIANWSSAEAISSEGQCHTGADDELARSVMQACRRARSSLPGWLGLLGMSAAYATLPSRWLVPRAESQWYASTRLLKLGNWITNLGPIPPELLDFGPARVVEAWPVVASYEPPTTITAIASVGNDLYLTLGSVEGHWDSVSEARLQARINEALGHILRGLRA